MIAKWLRDAKLPEDQVVHAVALALAATHGADHYRANPTVNPDLERQGLYALKQSDTPTDWEGDLFDPVQSSQALTATYRANGNRWDWHPVHVSGAVVELEPVVTMMLSNRKSSRGAVNVGSFRETLGRMTQLRDAVVQAGSDSGP
jgi:hypothetical protein